MQTKFHRYSDFGSLKAAKNSIKSSKQLTEATNDELKALIMILRKSIRKTSILKIKFGNNYNFYEIRITLILLVQVSID